MKVGYELTMQQTQKLIMTHQLQLAIKILQLPSLELNDYIQNELVENPVLETVPEEKSESEDREVDERIDWEELSKNFENGDDFENYYHDDEETASPLNFVAAVTTLKDHLLFQLRLTLKSHEDIDIGEYLIDNIDSAGYLRVSVDDTSAHFNVSNDRVESVLSVIQSFDPPGIGARDLKECLKIQLHQSGLHNELVEKVIDGYLNEIAENKYEIIAKGLSITPKEAQDIGDVVKGFQPKPGSGFADSNDIRYVTPDVYIDKVGEEYIITVNDKMVPRLSINAYYRGILKNDTKDKKTADYIKGKLDSALWLIKSIEQRKNTLYRVVNSIVSFQKDFLDRGQDFLKPLTLKEVAEEVGVHESTVSRAINGKYAQTPRGLFELKFFFTRGLDDSSGDNISSQKIKNMIKKIISGEDAAKPLSDQKISDMLAREGISISRRTVAKYREEMEIPSTSKRKRY